MNPVRNSAALLLTNGLTKARPIEDLPDSDQDFVV